MIISNILSIFDDNYFAIIFIIYYLIFNNNSVYEIEKKYNCTINLRIYSHFELCRSL